jgi:LPS export ABC transporter permease LptG
MKILTSYLFKEIFHYFRLFVAMFTVILLVYTLYDNLGDILKEKSSSPWYIIEYIIATIPGVLAMAFPMICLVSTIFSYGLLAKNKEILAMVASGISFQTLAFPALIFGIALTGVMFWFNESVVPAATSRAAYIMKVKIKGQGEVVLTKKGDQFVKGKGNRFYYVESYDSTRREMTFPTILDMYPGGASVATRIEADKAIIGKPDKKGVTWGELLNAERWAFRTDGTLSKYEKLDKPLLIPIDDNMEVFLTKNKKPEEMNFFELSQYIELIRQRGEDVDNFRTAQQRKLSFPISCLLMTLLGFVVVVDVHARHFARGVTLGLVIAIGFYVLDAFFTGLGKKGAMEPLLVGWVPLTVFLSIVAYLFTRMRKIRG